jgi:hypothetical protein
MAKVGKTSNTCIAVVRDKKGKLVFAGDRRASWHWGKAEITPRPKVIKRDGLLFGGTGDSYLIDVIAELTPILETTPNITAFEYMHSIFYNSIMDVLMIKGWVDKEGRCRFPSGAFAEIVVGIKSELYAVYISNDCDDPQDTGTVSIVPIATPYATGCGGPIAHGSLLTSEVLKPRMSAEDRLTLALRAAAAVSPGCDDNIDLVRE